MEKEWFILINNLEEGPFTLFEIKKDSRLTSDTLVWKEGFLDWIAARYVPEFADIFDLEDNEEEQKPQKEVKKSPLEEAGSFDMTLAAQRLPPDLLVWLILISLILIYVIYKLT